MPGLRDILDAATPGPWVVREQAPWDVLTEWEENDPFPRGRLVICEHAGVDAPLIALAPELAALVLDMGEYVEATGRYLASMNDPSPAVAQSEALLARLDQLGKEQTDG